MTIGANNLAFHYLVFQSLEANFPTKTPDTEQFILFIPMMEIENSLVFDSASTTPSFPFVIGKPFIMLGNKGLFCGSITITTLVTPINLCFSCQRDTKSIRRTGLTAILAELIICSIHICQHSTSLGHASQSQICRTPYRTSCPIRLAQRADNGLSCF